MDSSRSPIWLEPTPAKAAVVASSIGATRWRTVVVKLACAIERGGRARLVEADDLVDVERHYDGDPTRSVLLASDLAPRKAGVDVTLTGHAYAPPGRAVEAARTRAL